MDTTNLIILAALISAVSVGGMVTLLACRRRSTPGSRGRCLSAFRRQKGVVYYRTRDGRADYGFSFQRQDDGSYRAYIRSQPDYGARDTSLHATHRLRDDRGYYVCWSGTLRTEAEARRVAALWADKTQEYIRTGRRF